jgi:hypothetical protein
MPDLFDLRRQELMEAEQPLAARMRPRTLDFWAVWGLPSHNEYVHVPFAA